MPIYEYHCPECDNLFEEWCQRVDDQKSKPCPKCGKTAQRIMSQTSFALKGDGWYVTEYGSKKGINESSESNASQGDKTSGDSSASADSSAASTASSPSSTAGTGSSQSSQAPAAKTTSSTAPTPSTPAP